MRIDAIQVAANAAAETTAPLEHPSAPAPSAVDASQESARPAVNLPKARELSVSVSFIENQVLVYRFMDAETGDLIQQVPPEQVLEVMRSIDQILNAEDVHQNLDIRL